MLTPELIQQRIRDCELIPEPQPRQYAALEAAAKALGLDMDTTWRRVTLAACAPPEHYNQDILRAAAAYVEAYGQTAP